MSLILIRLQFQNSFAARLSSRAPNVQLSADLAPAPTQDDNAEQASTPTTDTTANVRHVAPGTTEAGVLLSSLVKERDPPLDLVKSDPKPSFPLPRHPPLELFLAVPRVLRRQASLLGHVY